jgi:hypothetical protein
MKEKNSNPFSEISSFEDFKLEKERLLLKSKLIETRINLSILLISKVFSFSNLIFSVIKQYVLPKN